MSEEPSFFVRSMATVSLLAVVIGIVIEISQINAKLDRLESHLERAAQAVNANLGREK